MKMKMDQEWEWEYSRKKIKKQRRQKRMQLIRRMLFFFCVLIGGFAALDFAWGAFGQEGPANDLLKQKYELNEVYAAEALTGEALEEGEAAVSNPEETAEPEKENPFEAFYYYEKDKQYRYEAYQQENPDLPAGDVVWMVNVGLDHKFYTMAQAAEVVEAGPMLVNKYRYLPKDYAPKQLVSVGKGKRMEKTAAEAFKELKKAAKTAGFYLQPVSAFRTYQYQENLHNNYMKRQSEEEVDTFSSREGFSEHQTGLTVDINTGQSTLRAFAGTQAAEWVEKHCGDFGFIVRYPEGEEEITGYEYEPWHITYVGVETAADMKARGINTLEEYYVKYIEHSPDETDIGYAG